MALCGSSAAWAQNTVTLTPSSPSTLLGEIATVELAIDFSDPAIGGGIVVDFDAALLSFQDFTFDPAAPDDPSLRLVCPSASSACASFTGPGVLVAFAVDTVTFPAIAGAHTLGSLRFMTLAEGSAALSTREDDSVAGPILGVGAFAPPALGGATVEIGSGGEPVPSARPVALFMVVVVLAVTGLLVQRRSRDACVAAGAES